MNLNRRDFLKMSSVGGLAFFLEMMKPELISLASKVDPSGFPKMLYREYGQTGKRVSILGFGGMRFDSESVRKGNLEDSARVMVEAYDLGVNYFDTAPTYVGGKSEEIFGLAFKEIDRKMKDQKSPLPYYYTSKSGDLKGAEMRRRLETTLTRLGKSKLHFYHMWCIMDYNHFQEVMKPGGSYEAAVAAKKEGLIEHIVFSSHAGSQDTIKMLNEKVFDGMLIGYNILNFPKQEKAIQAAIDHKMGVVIMNPLAGGLIPQHQDYFNKLVSPDQKGISVVQTALNFIMGQQGITVALAGITNQKQLHENVKALNYLEIFSDQKLASLKKQYLKKIEDICTTCQYCNVCPVDIPVWTVMEFFNEYILKGKDHAIRSLDSYKRYEKVDIKAEIKKCIRCRACEKACTQHLPILERFDIITGQL
ncbi:MAG: aldo/keto reductase [Candidatus Delongbacteria bacterium]|nr:aldo/keto reductase [Candidatus Delongbacteria bacterium]